MTTSRNLSVWGGYTGTVNAPVANIPNIAETATNDTTSTISGSPTLNYNAITQSVLWYNNATVPTSNWTLNFRGSASVSLNTFMATGQSITLAFLVTTGATAYYNSAVTIDGNSVTPKWQGGTAPTAGNASSVDIYTYTIVKTASATFTVFASQTQFK